MLGESVTDFFYFFSMDFNLLVPQKRIFENLFLDFQYRAVEGLIGGFTSSQHTIGVLLINCSRSGMFYYVLWYVSLFVVVCGMSSEKPYTSLSEDCSWK